MLRRLCAPATSRPSNTIRPEVGGTSHRVNILKRSSFPPIAPDDAVQLAVVHDEVDVAVGDKAAVNALVRRLASRIGLKNVPVLRPRGGNGVAGGCPVISARSVFCPSAAVMPGIGAASSGSRPPTRFRRRHLIEIPDAADQPAAQETDQQHAHKAQDQLPGRAQVKRGLQESSYSDSRADQGAEQRAACRQSRSGSPVGLRRPGKASGGMKPCITLSIAPANPA